MCDVSRRINSPVKHKISQGDSAKTGFLFPLSSIYYLNPARQPIRNNFKILFAVIISRYIQRL